MAAPDIVTPVPADIASDGLLVERIAALSDRAALDELDARHGLTLYALAYALTFDRNAGDEAVSATFREVWRSAGSYTGATSVQRWLAGLTRRIVQDWLVEAAAAHAVPLQRRGAVTVATRALPAPAATPRRRLRALARMLGGAIVAPALRYVRSAAAAIRPPALLPAEPSSPRLQAGTPPWPLDPPPYSHALKAS